MDIEPVFQFFKIFRTRRMRFFYGSFQLKPETTVLDVGGREFNWGLMPFAPTVTILNVSHQGEHSGRFEWVIGDARQLPFPDEAFDIVYSNSVIEHLGGIEDQHAFAAECRRVGRSYFIQTPNRNFPIEPHVLTPFIHWLPKTWQAPLLRNFTVWGWITRPGPEAQRRFLNTTRMLTRGELQELFPDAEIQAERFCGLAKSFIAFKRAANAPNDS
ncbi:MAG: class I SAM-dependent methyltransferase [Chthoniobacterales bacterium]